MRDLGLPTLVSIVTPTVMLGTGVLARFRARSSQLKRGEQPGDVAGPDPTPARTSR